MYLRKLVNKKISDINNRTIRHCLEWNILGNEDNEWKNKLVIKITNRRELWVNI